MIKTKAQCITSLLSVILFCLIANLLFVQPSPSEAAVTTALQGPAFSDPSKQVTMPDDWVKKPVVHDPAYPDADLGG